MQKVVAVLTAALNLVWLVVLAFIVAIVYVWPMRKKVT